MPKAGPTAGERIRELERRVAALEERLRLDAAKGWSPVEEGEAAAPAAPAPPLPAPGTPGPVFQPPAPLPPMPVPPPPAAVRTAGERRASFEWLLGGNWLARIGVLILALGVLFFLKLSFDNGWVPLWGRAAIGVVGGLALFATGELLRRRSFDPVYCQVLAGGGAIIAYATLYAAYVLPHYRAALGLTLPVEVVLLAGVSALLGAYAVWRDLPVLAGVAIGLTALLVAPAGDFSTVGLLFVGLMGSGLLLAAAWRGWSNVVLTSILAVDAAHVAAAVTDDIPWSLTLASAIVVNALAVLAAARSRDPNPVLPRVEASLAALGLFAVAALALDAARIADPVGWAFLGVGLASVASCLAVPRLAPSLGATGAVLLLLWPFAHFDGAITMVAAHLGLAAAATVVSLVLRRGARWIRLVGTAAVGLGAITLVGWAGISGLADRRPWEANGLAALAVALATTLWLLEGRRQRAAPLPEGRTASAAFPLDASFVVLALLVLLWPLVQFGGFVEVALFAAVVLLLLLASAWTPVSLWLRLLAVAVLAVGTLSLWGQADDVDGRPLAAGALALTLLALAAATWRLEAGTGTGRGMPHAVARWGALAVAMALTAVWPMLQFRADMAQVVLYAVLALGAWAATFSLRAERSTLLAWASGLGIVGTLALLGLGADGRIDAQAALAAVGTALLAATAAAVWATARRPSAGGRTPLADAARFGALAVVAGAPLVGVAYLLAGWGITVSWATLAFGLVAAGLALRAREVRYAALATFGLVIGRIFLYDLANLSLPARVVAFILTGALLLLAAYLFARQRKAETQGAAAVPPVPSTPEPPAVARRPGPPT